MIGQLQSCQRARLAGQIRPVNRALRPRFSKFSHAESSLKGQPSIFEHDFRGIIQRPRDQPRLTRPLGGLPESSTLMPFRTAAGRGVRRQAADGCCGHTAPPATIAVGLAAITLE